ncbi:MAG: hypothetical protein Greene041662_868, partial [Candidatus Peregrinibacteria bacterium Greene0416_62]
MTGVNGYQISEERHRWISGFREKHGAENCSRIAGATITYPLLLDEIAVLPFTAQKRLVVVEGVPAFEKEEMERLPKDIHPDVLLLFIDGSPDRRRSGIKALLTLAEVRDCPELLGSALEAWIRDMFAKEGTSILPQALRALLGTAGNEQIILIQEIYKLALHSMGKPVTEADVEMLVLPAGERNIWQLMDLLAEGDPGPRRGKEATGSTGHAVGVPRRKFVGNDVPARRQGPRAARHPSWHRRVHGFRATLRRQRLVRESDASIDRAVGT